MKFLVASNILLKQLSAINGVVASNPIIPILENILVELEGNTLILTASDLQERIDRFTSAFIVRNPT
jgi:DNA polymerase-3 subunit beta